MASPTKILLETLKRLNLSELQDFKFFLLETGIPRIPSHLIDLRENHEIVELLVKTYHERSVEVARNTLKKIKRNDLVQMLSGSSSTFTGKSFEEHRFSL